MPPERGAVGQTGVPDVLPMSRARKIQAILLVAVLTPLALFLGAGWHYSGEIQERGFIAHHESNSLDLKVTSIADGRITLAATSNSESDGRWNKAGTWGLESAGTYNRVSTIVDVTSDTVVRELITLGPLPRVGDHVRIDSYAYPGDPLISHGIEFREVGVPAALGTFPAWLTTGESDTWVILVHGQGADRREFLRTLPMFVERGYPTLTITYRNDQGLPSDPEGYYRFGAEEWEELEAAATFALEAGARDVILVGYSMGGAIAVSFLYNSEVADRVRGVILDSPALDLEEAIDFNAGRERVFGIPLPDPLTELAKLLTTLRFGIDFSTMNHLDRAAELPPSTPILLFHGSDDSSVPVSLSDKLAEARPGIVEYHVFPEATHVGSWNLDAERYESVVHGFLDRLDQTR